MFHSLFILHLALLKSVAAHNRELQAISEILTRTGRKRNKTM